jgi:hypothetical protein
MALMTASVPLLTKRTTSIEATASTTARASLVSASVGMPKLVPRDAAFSIAAMTGPGAWPRMSGP